MPNFSSNLSPSLVGRAWDKQTLFAAPWASGLTGMAYNASITSGVASIDDLLTNPALKARWPC